MAKNYFGITDTGKMRQNNEDTFIAQHVLNNRYIAACVIDGVGGYEGGEVAAQLAHDAILDTFKSKGDDVIATLKEAFTAANERIYKNKKASTDKDQMACVLTLALADVPNNKFYYAHVGDTRLYLLRDSSLVKITKDHSFVGFLEDSGRLSEDAAMKHPKRNEINKALGFDGAIAADGYIETGESPFLPNDVIMLCSDGLSDMISNNAMTTILTSNQTLAEKGKALIQAANDAGGKDNITVVLVQNDKQPVKHEATRPISVVKKNEEVRTTEISDAQEEVQMRPVEKKRKKGGGGLIVFLFLLLIAAVGWWLFKDYANKKEHEQNVANIVTVKKRNLQEQQLLDSINGSTTQEVFIVNQAGGQPIVISDSIVINKDTLHIIGNGATLLRDTSYNGPALILSSSTKYVLLDSLIIENFDIGILVHNEGLHFKNVQFRNCRVPVDYRFNLPNNRILNGPLRDTVFYTTDSVLRQ